MMTVRTDGNLCPSKAFLMAVVIWEWAWTTWIVCRFGKAARHIEKAVRMVAVW